MVLVWLTQDGCRIIVFETWQEGSKYLYITKNDSCILDASRSFTLRRFADEMHMTHYWLLANAYNKINLSSSDIDN
jgi:hypothetical protein